MTTATTSLPTPKVSNEDSGALPALVRLPIAASTKILAGTLVGPNSSGYIVDASSGAVRILGIAAGQFGGMEDVDNSAGANGALSVTIKIGSFALAMGTGADVIANTNAGQPVYAIDNATVGLTDGAGARPYAGYVLSVETPLNTSTAVANIAVGAFAPPTVAGDPGTMPTAFKARAVMTSQASMNAYTGTGTGTLTAGANGAMGAQDGITLAVGDVVLVPAVVTGATITAADIGPYVISSLGGASAKIVLTRPSWWEHGATIQTGQAITVGEGTIWAGIDWKPLCAKGGVVDTTDPAMYPRIHKGTGAVGTGVTALFATSNAVPTAIDETAAAAVNAVLVAGYGTGTLTFTGTGTDAIGWTVQNF